MTETGDLSRLRDVERAILERAPEHDLTPSLDRIREVCDLLGSPQAAAPVVHVAGTNGKTSTTRMIDALLREFGLRTGRFTSPHLHTMRERISFDGQPIDPERFIATYDDVAPYLDLVDSRHDVRLSFFEVLTAMAFAAFADAPVDVAVLEVGMGGAWDATNVADAQVAVVTPIDIDHTHFLGSTLTEIAGEKAGILKPGSYGVLAQQPVEAAEVLLRRSVEVDAIVAREGLEFGVMARTLAVGGQLVTLRGLAGEYDEMFLPLLGAHQAHNAAVRPRRRRGLPRRRARRARTARRRPGAGRVRRRAARRGAWRPCAARRPWCSTRRTTRPAPARPPRPWGSRSGSTGWSACSPRWPTRTSAACSRRSSRCWPRS